MPFGRDTCVVPSNTVLNGALVPPGRENRVSEPQFAVMPPFAKLLSPLLFDEGTRGIRLTKNDYGSVLQKNCSFWFGFGVTKVTAVLVFCTVCCLMCTHSMLLYRYRMKKNTLTADSVMVKDEL